jgi:hypothetical protein
MAKPPLAPSQKSEGRMKKFPYPCQSVKSVSIPLRFQVSAFQFFPSVSSVFLCFGGKYLAALASWRLAPVFVLIREIRV